MKGKRGRPPKKIVKHNPVYSKLIVKKVLQDYFLTDHNNPLLVQESNEVIEAVLDKLERITEE